MTLLALALSCVHTVSAQLTHHVPAEHTTIQAAIDVASDGDTILVGPGTYNESIDFLRKSIQLVSESGAEATVISGVGEHTPTVTVDWSVSASIQGFTITSGDGGISTRFSSLEIADNIIRENTGCSSVGIYTYKGTPTIRNNVITENSQKPPQVCGGGGGGIGMYVLNPDAPIEIVNNWVSDNVAFGGDGAGMKLVATDGASVENNVVMRNRSLSSLNYEGGGITVRSTNGVVLSQNLIVANESARGGGISIHVPFGDDGPKLVNNTIAHNVATSGTGSQVQTSGWAETIELVNNIVVADDGSSAIYCDPEFDDYSEPMFWNNNVYAGSGQSYSWCFDPTGQNGNVSVDPIFIDSAAENYRLSFDAPVIDAGDNFEPELPLLDLDGVSRIQDGNHDGSATVDMGAFEVTREVRATKDTFLTKSIKNRNEGANPKLVVDARRVVIEFDLDNLSASTIHEVALRLTLAEPAKFWGRDRSLRRCSPPARRVRRRRWKEVRGSERTEDDRQRIRSHLELRVGR